MEVAEREASGWVDLALRRARLVAGGRQERSFGPAAVDAMERPRAALAETLVDFAYCAHAKHLWRGRRLAVTWTGYCDGMGDATTAAKVAELLAPHVALEVWLPQAIDGAASLFPFLPAHALLAHTLRLSAPRPPPDLLVWVNAQDRSRARQRVCGAEVPVLHVLEHDLLERSHAARVLATGFGREGAGFFTGLLCVDGQRGPLSRRAPPGSSTAVYRALGLDAPMRADASRAVSLHTCYPSRAGVETVVASCLAFAGDTSEPLDVVLVAKHFHTTLREAEALSASNALFFFELWVAGGTSAHCLAAPTRGSGHSQVLPGRRRLLLTPVIAAADFSLCLAQSDFAVVTGDQSLSEAISLGIPFAYDAPPHKKRSKSCLAALAPRALGEGGRRALGDDLPGCAAFWRQPDVAHGLRAHLAELALVCDVAPRLIGRCLQLIGPENGPAAICARILDACHPLGGDGSSVALERLWLGLEEDLAHLTRPSSPSTSQRATAGGTGAPTAARARGARSDLLTAGAQHRAERYHQPP